MQSIPLPTKIQFKEGKNPFSALVTLEPCFPGHGITIGNALRRNLLSALPGAAITSFKIKGVLHDFSAVKGVKEDVVDISLNLKQLRLRVHSDQPVRLHLKAKGEKEVTGGDIEPNSDAEVISKDLVIATLTDKTAQFEMELVAEQGRGYVPAEAREKDELETGMVIIDSSFTPIRRVGFNVENIRVGQMTNWDKLVIDIETDGTISPETAIKIAVKDLIDHFTFIDSNIVIEEKPAKKSKKKEKEPVAKDAE